MIKTEEILERHEVDDMIGVAQSNQIQVLIILLYLTGHRITEILSLRKEDIWFIDDKMYIKLMVQKRRERYTHTISFGKDTPYITNIRDYVNGIGETRLLFESEYNYDKPITRQYARMKLKELNPKAFPHCFRHTRATKLAELGYNSYQIQAWFGWKTIGISTNYVSKGTALIKDMGNNIR